MAFWDKLKIIEKIKLDGSYQSLIDKADFDVDFIFRSFAGLSTCVLGMSVNSVPIVVGAMIISPLIYSILILPASIIWKDKEIFLVNVRNLFLEFFFGVIICYILSFILNINIQNVAIVSRMGNNPIIYFLVAILAGSSAVFSLFSPDVSEELTGVAVSVALVPPIAVMGIALDNFSTEFLLKAGSNLLLNFLGIVVGAYLTLRVFKKRFNMLT
jgi:uncharacterized hydrophobic protein (TIGR00271 family)